MTDDTQEEEEEEEEELQKSYRSGECGASSIEIR